MRVAYICADPGVPVFGHKGSSIHVQSVVRGLRRQGATVELVCARTDGSAPPDLADVPIHRLPQVRHADAEQRERGLLAANAQLANALHLLGPVDLVYERYSLWSRAGMDHALTNGTSSVLEVNAPLIEEQAAHRTLVHRDAAETVARSVIGAARTVVAVSEPVAAWARGKAGSARTPVYVVPNGVDTDRIRPADPAARRTGFKVGFVGTLKPWHGVHTLLRAFATGFAGQADAGLLLVGDGPESARLRLLADQLGIGDQVELTGSVDHAGVATQLHRMDVAVAPYPDSPEAYFSPLKLYEYLAAGLPIIASAVGQATGVLGDGRNAVLVPPGDVPALAGQLMRLRDDEDLRTRLGAAARSSAVQHHTWDAAVRRILSLAGAEPAEAEVAGAGEAGRAA
ncbi:MAG: glycosyltransferase family 4 protein [Geodermatophilaceae bacterium]|nr:glycosyltransferase family 4 protein [Geodermatophilaceae bacterium]